MKPFFLSWKNKHLPSLPFCVLTILLFQLSCKKAENTQEKEIAQFEQVNGSYKGNIYKWSRDYDSTFTQIIEKRDTTFNVAADLNVNVNQNIIEFGNVNYIFHDELNTLLGKDTIDALFNASTHPYHSIRIIRSSQFVRVFTSSYAPSGPGAYTIIEEYYKN